MHAGGMGAMEAAHPPWDGDHRHGWATGAQHSAQVLQVESSVGSASSASFGCGEKNTHKKKLALAGAQG